MRIESFVGACVVLALLPFAQAAESCREVRMLEGEHWWGLATWWGEKMPFDASTDVKIDIREDGYANQYQSFMVSDQGRYIWCDGQTTVTIRGGRMKFVSDGADVLLVKAGETLRDAFLAGAKDHFPPSGRTPDLTFYEAPQYCTWIELNFRQNEKGILSYAKSMLDNGLPPGILMIDDTWQAGYGTWEFEPSRFADPKGMIGRLHDMGFKVLLWICPFVQMDSPTYRYLSRGLNPSTLCHEKDVGGLLLDPACRDSDQTAAVRWWNGKSALLDFTHPFACKWFSGECDRLISKYGADGFKFDAGHLIFYTRGYRAHKDVSSGLQARAYGEFCLKYPVCEFRNAYGLAGQPIVERLNDKGHNWDDLGKCVTDLLAAGLLGYSFVCPDMIGGGLLGSFMDGVKIDEELFVRSCQMQALCGMMQFSASPWRVLSSENQELVRQSVRLRQKFAPYFVETAKACAQTGEPFLRALEYSYPKCGYVGIRDEFLVGENLLVAPVLEKGAVSREVTIPPGKWRMDDGKVVVGPSRITVETPLARLPYMVKAAADSL